MRSFPLAILSPERAFFVGDCVSLVIPISDGMLGIMAGHTPLTAAIRDGEVAYTLPDGRREICAVTRGMVSVSAAGVRLLCESALAPDEIDEAAEKRRIQAELLHLKEKQGHKDFLMTQLALAKAINNLKVKRHDAMKINHQ
ncbi:MAG: F0F1 ATP synthase subunit epsilon [Clostridia bacterium]|nr:F0F1 ATP synthase subunit epsilon [Clostridia bacterium]